MIPVALESSAGYESEGDLEHLKSLDKIIYFAMGQVQWSTADQAWILLW